jgi:methylmalonyl-CoA mutase
MATRAPFHLHRYLPSCPSPKLFPIPKHKIRVVTAASLFDGNDSAINTMRRIIQSTGAEVIHLGHDRSVEDVVNTAFQEAPRHRHDKLSGGHRARLEVKFDLLIARVRGNRPC